jgi:hypothetical protein
MINSERFYEHMSIVEQAYAAFQGCYDDVCLTRFDGGFTLEFMKGRDNEGRPKMVGRVHLNGAAVEFSYADSLPEIRQLAIYGAAHLARENAPYFDILCDAMYKPETDPCHVS